jgi:hypothetical protein
MPEEATQVLAQFAAALTYEQLPNRVKEHCKNLLLDALACALAGHQGEETHQVAALASSLAQSSETSVIGGDHLCLRRDVVQRRLITAVTMCDAHRTMTHVTPEVVPPALAIAERTIVRPRSPAATPPVEVTTRIGIGLDHPAFLARGFHGPGVLAFGAAAAVGRPRGFDAETMARVRPCGCRRRGRSPRGERRRSTISAAALGPVGRAARRAEVHGDPRIPHGQGRYLYNAYANGGRPGVTADLGRRWEMERSPCAVAVGSLTGMNTARSTS